MDPRQAEQVARITQAMMGGQPQQAAPPQQGAMPQQPPAPPAQPAAAPETQEEKASRDGAPRTNDARAGEEPVVYKIKFGEEERDLTPEQISATFARYGALNNKHAQLKPIVEIGERLVERVGDPEKAAQFLVNAIRGALQKNPQMGGQEDGKSPVSAQAKPRSNEDISEALKKWEDENGASLPPGYREMVANMGATQTQMQQMMQMMQHLMGAASGQVDAARQAGMQQRQSQIEMMKQRVAQNLDAVQARLGLPDEAGQEFMIFAGERGYSLEDFVDPGLTMRVAQDFVNARNSGEFERLKQVHQRRQAFTGSLGQTPSMTPGAEAGAPKPANESEAMLGRIFDKAAARRFQ